MAGLRTALRPGRGPGDRPGQEVTFLSSRSRPGRGRWRSDRRRLATHTRRSRVSQCTRPRGRGCSPRSSGMGHTRRFAGMWLGRRRLNRCDNRYQIGIRRWCNAGRSVGLLRIAAASAREGTIGSVPCIPGHSHSMNRRWQRAARKASAVDACGTCSGEPHHPLWRKSPPDRAPRDTRSRDSHYRRCTRRARLDPHCLWFLHHQSHPRRH
jgi:hypothetical protein